MPSAIFVQRASVPEQHEIRLRPFVDDLEAVVPQMTFEEGAGVELRFGEQQRCRHANERTGSVRPRLDVLSHRNVTNALQAAGADNAPEEP
jgi:hypothetical protein